MLLWLLAALVGALTAALQYGRRSAEARTAPLALLRALSAALIVALLLGAPAGRASEPKPEVALDASESWLRAADSAAWRNALDSARRLGGSSIRRFGDSLRADADKGAPRDLTSRLRSVVDAASAAGTPTIVITDGEVDDAELLAGLPRGSRVIVVRGREGRDLAVAEMDAPRALLTGDSITVQTTLLSGAAGSEPARLTLQLDGTVLAIAAVPALPPYTERALPLRGVAAGAERGAVLQVIVQGDGDSEPRNDTLAVGVDVSRAPGAVFLSTAPDFDAREAVAALRGVSSLPTRAYYRVAPGMWRTDGMLERVDEATVRAALRDAPIVVLHGDTAAFGPPRAASRGALLLFAPPAIEDGEWFVSAIPSSPIAPALRALPLDSLSPLRVAADLPRGEWQGLITHRGGAPDDRRAALIGWESPRRVAVLGASGLWRWRFRGGVRADAYSALFGALYDWLAAGATDRRAAVPDVFPLRAGEPIRWRRGASADSVVWAVITRRGAPLRRDSLRLRFNDGGAQTQSPPLPAGVYDVRTAGGDAVLAVNQSREMVPRRPTVRTGAVGDEPAAGVAPSLRDQGWVYALVVLLLCAEWLLRRKVGLR